MSRRRLVIGVATVLGFAVPALLYLWVIHHYGVNVIFGDQWDDVNLIGQSYSGAFHFSALWAQHNENRIFFPNLIVLALARFARYNVVVEEYLAALMLFAATALIIWAHKRRSPSTRLFWYCPVAFLLLSLGQSGNTLWGFQMAWYLVMLMLAVTLFLLDREPPGGWPLGGAVMAAVVGSFSSLQGLLIWPAGLLLMHLRRRPRSQVAIWVGSGLAAGYLYFHGFDFSVTTPSDGGVLHHPLGEILYFLKTIGDLPGAPSPGGVFAWLGAIILGLGLWVMWAYRRREKKGSAPSALALVAYGTLFCVVVTVGRSTLFASSESRYTVFAALVLVGIYLALLGGSGWPGVARPWAAQWEDSSRASVQPQLRLPKHRAVHASRWIPQGVTGLLVVAVVAAGTVEGIATARQSHSHRIAVARVEVRTDVYPSGLLNILGGGRPPQVIRQLSDVAEKRHLSIFGSADASMYLRQPPIRFNAPPPKAAVFLLTARRPVSGTILVSALVSDIYDITHVGLYVRGPGSTTKLIGSARSSPYGWFVRWRTGLVTNGRYSVLAVISDADGRTATSPPVEVSVRN